MTMRNVRSSVPARSFSPRTSQRVKVHFCNAGGQLKCGEEQLRFEDGQHFTSLINYVAGMVTRGAS